MVRTVRILIAATALIAIAGAIVAPARRSHAADAADAPDIRRVILPPERIAAELEKAHRGGLQLMPRDDFEELVRAAMRPPREPATLATAAYRARFNGTDLVGSGEWTVRNPNRMPTLMSVEPVQIAFRKIRWGDGSIAHLGPLVPRGAAAGNELLLERNGDRTLLFDWSARGVTEPAGTRFDLRLPACSVSELELDLPADRGLSPPRDGSVTSGPLPGPTPDRRLWRLNIGRNTDLDLIVLPIAPVSTGPPLILARQRSRFEPAAAQVSCEFAFDLDVLRGSAAEFIVEFDAGFEPVEVSVRNLDRWEIRSSAADRNSRVFVRLHDAIAAGSLTIRGFMTLPADRRWIAPRATLIGAIRRGETITVRIPQDISLEDWRSGTFSILDSSGAPERIQTITLQSSLIGDVADRPSAFLRVRGDRVRVVERLWWSVEADKSTLLAQLSVEPVQGVVASIPLRIPAGWTVDRVESSPADALESWWVETAGQSPVVHMELSRPVAVGQRAELRMTMTRLDRALGAQGGQLPWPDVEPVGVVDRSGFVAMRLAPNLRLRPSSALVSAAIKPEDGAASPWGAASPHAAIALPRDALRGNVEIERQSGRSPVRGHCDIEVWPGRMSVRERLEFTPLGGLESIHLLESTRGEWRVTRGSPRVKSSAAHAIGTALPLLAADNFWSVLTAAAPRIAWHRIELSDFTAEPFELESVSMRPNDSGLMRPIELPRVIGADPIDWQVSIVQHPGVNVQCGADGDALSDVHWDGLGSRIVAGTGRFSFLQFEPDISPPRSAALVQASLLVDATVLGRLKHELTVETWNVSDQSIAIDLPRGAKGARARINSKDLMIAKQLALDDGGTRIELPLTGANDRYRIQVEYVVAIPLFTFGSALPAAMPSMPNVTAAIRTAWRLPEGVEPASSGEWSSAADSVSDRNRARIWVGAGSNAASNIWVLNVPACRFLGLAIAAIIVLIGLQFEPRNAARWAYVTGLLLALCAIGLPHPLAGLVRWPLLAFATLIVRPWIRWPSISRVGGVSVRPQAAAMGIAAAFCLGAVGRAAAPSAVVVFIVPAAQDSKGREMVLAPLGLAARLRTAASDEPSPDRVVATTAAYRGSLVDGFARIQATLELHAFGEGPTPFVIPFGLANLHGLRLDGKPALPMPNGDRVAIAVTGRGGHRLEVEFSVPYPFAGERELKFAIPELLQSYLEFAAPRGAENLRVIAWRGSQEVAVSETETLLRADLGRVGVVHVRWTQDAAIVPASIRAQEACLWDLQNSSVRLLASTRWTIENAAVQSLEIEIPDELELATVSARPIDLAAGATPTAWLQSWRIVGAAGQRRLRMLFSAPISGTWQSISECVPREPFADTFTLPFPAAHGVAIRESSYAWRSRRGQLAVSRLQGVAEIPVESFLKDTWLQSKAEPDPRPPNHAYLRTGTGSLPIIRLTASPIKPTATGAIEWTLGPARAEIVCHCHYVAKEDRIGLCEWEVPSNVRVNEVASADLLTWSRSGNRLQIWFQKPAAETDIRWTGSVLNPVIPIVRFELPDISAIDVSYEGTLRASCQSGFRLTPSALQQLELRPITGKSGREWEYRAIGPGVRGSFELTPMTSPAEARPAPLPTKQPRPEPARVAPAECLMADLASTQLGDLRWLHSARFALRGDWPKGLRLTWAEAVQIVDLRADLHRYSPPLGLSTVVALPAHASEEMHYLQSTWIDGDSSALSVRAQCPRLEADGQIVEPKRVLWTVATPMGSAVADAPQALSREERDRLRAAARLPDDSNSGETLAYLSSSTWELSPANMPARLRIVPTNSGRSPAMRALAILALSGAGLWTLRRLGSIIWPEMTAGLALGGWLATGGFVWLIPLTLAAFARAGSLRRVTDPAASA